MQIKEEEARRIPNRREVDMRFCVLTIGFVLLSCSAQASAIIGLCGTGRAVNCGALQYSSPTGGQQDGNYTVYKLSSYQPLSYPGTLVTANNASGHPLVLSKSSQYGPSNAWVDYDTGKWVAPLDSAYPDPGCTSPGTNNNPACSYYAMYYISFNLPTGTILGSISVTGSWTADDTGYIVVNGNSLHNNSASTGGHLIESCDPNSPFCGNGAGLTSFTLSNATGAGFVTGTNYIGFVVDQADNWYDGVDVSSLSGTYNSSVPEPGTWTLFAAGALALGMLRRRQA